MFVALARLNLNNQTKMPFWTHYLDGILLPLPPNDNQGGAISSTFMSLKVISFSQVL